MGIEPVGRLGIIFIVGMLVCMKEVAWDGDVVGSALGDAVVGNSSSPHTGTLMHCSSSLQNQSSPTLMYWLKQLSNKPHLSIETSYPSSIKLAGKHLYEDPPCFPFPPALLCMLLGALLFLLSVGCSVSPHNPNGVVSEA